MVITKPLQRFSAQRVTSHARCNGPLSRCRSGKNHKRSYNRNQQYSITAITDGSGGIVERYAYTAYGTPTITDASGTTRTTTATGNRYTYTGREWDETLALYHYRSRMYDSVGGRFCSRDPIGYVDGNNYYMYVDCMPVTGIDPTGTKTQMPFDDYWDWWKTKHPHLSQPELDKCEKQLAAGCIGITVINTGSPTGKPDMSSCYNSRNDAKKACPGKKCGPGEKLAGFSIHLWNNGQPLPTNPDGTVNLDPWWSGGPKGRPKGDWDGDGVDDGPGINFDFGFVTENGTILHADQYHNPDRDGDGIGDYFPNYPPRDATLYGSDLGEWQQSYSDFDTEVWCVTCRSAGSIPSK